MAGLVLILTGPPGAGKSTVARLLADGNDRPSVHLHTDDFYTAIRKGFVAPYLPEASEQNKTVIGVIVEAALGYAEGGYDVVIDGIVGPWFLDPFRVAARSSGVAFDYVVLRPSEIETVQRGVARTGDMALRDEAVIRNLWQAFQRLGALETHVVDSTGKTAAETAALVKQARQTGHARLGG